MFPDNGLQKQKQQPELVYVDIVDQSQNIKQFNIIIIAWSSTAVNKVWLG